LRVPLFLLLVGLVAIAPAFAGSAVIGSVAGSMNATVGGQALVPNATIFSGDSLQVKDGVAIVAVGKASRMVFGRDTAVSFLRDAKEVTVLLGRGNVSLFHPDESGTLRVKAGEVSIVPAAGFKTLGEIAMLNGSLVVTTKEGMLLVEHDGQTMKVAKGSKPFMLSAPAANPQSGPATGASTVLQAGALGGSVASVITSAIAVSRAGAARDAANSAASNASAALSAANTAGSYASAANSSAQAAETILQNIICAVSTSPSGPPLLPLCCTGPVCPVLTR